MKHREYNVHINAPLSREVTTYASMHAAGTGSENARLLLSLRCARLICHRAKLALYATVSSVVRCSAPCLERQSARYDVLAVLLKQQLLRALMSSFVEKHP